MYYRKRFLLGLTLLVNILKVHAQSATIRGVVFEKQNRVPIEFASVAILHATDSSIVTGGLTENNGVFSIPKIDIGDYILKVISIGFETQYAGIEITNKNQEVVLDTIYLNISINLLEEVVVKGEKSTISSKLEKQIYTADRFESAKGGTATDVLKNLPSVAVNSAGEITVRGSSGFLVLINGKPVLTDPQTILSQLPANSIENIELITAPSAKYDADGKAGIINIITKKGITDGVGIQANIVAGLPSTTDYDNLENPNRMGADITMNIKKSKWDISLSGNYTRNDANGKRDGDVYTKDFTRNIITRFPSVGERSFDRYNYGIRTAISYAANKNSTWGVGFFASKKYQQRRADILYNNSVADLATNGILKQFTYFNSNLQNKEGTFVLGSIDYAHIFKNNSKLVASAMYENVDLYGNTLNNNVDYPALATSFQFVTNPYTNPIAGYRLKLDYSASIGHGKLETGYQYRRDNQSGTFGYTVTPAIQQSDIDKFRGTATSSNQINGVYAQYANTSSKLQYITGLRYESASREVILSSDTKPHLLNLNNIFPSVNLQYTINSSWNAKAGYSKRVQRNNNFELNPIPEREHSETLEQGDPDLLPQFIDLVEMGVNTNFTKGSFFTTIYYQHIQNPIQRVNSVYADTILNRLFTNAERARLIGIELGSNLKLKKWWTSYIGTTIYNYKITGDLDVLGNISVVNYSDWVYSINMNSTFDLSKNWNLQANLNYLSARPTAQGEDSRFLSPNIAVKKTFANGKYIFGFQWQNINLRAFNANQQRITTWGNDFYTTTNYIYETDVLLLNCTFNLNKLNSKSKLPASELGEKEF